MPNKPKIYDHLSGAAVGAFFFSLAVFDNELYIRLVYFAAVLMCMVMALGLLMGNVRNIRIQSPVYAYLGLILWGFATMLWAENFNVAYSKALSMMQIAVAMFVITHMVYTNLTIRYILLAMLLAIAVNYLVYKGLYSPNKFVYIGDRFIGMLGNANELGRIVILYLIIAMYVVVVDRNVFFKLAAGIGVLMAAMIILATQSRTGLVVMGLITAGSIILMRGFLQKLITIGLAFVVLTYGVVATETGTELVSNVIERFEGAVGSGVSGVDNSTAGRLEMIDRAWEMFVQNPLGSGLGAFEDRYGAYAHNAPMDLLANVGILGLAFWWSIYVLVYFKAKKIPEAHIRYTLYLGITAAFIFEMSDVFYAKRSGVVIVTMLLVMCMVNVNSYRSGRLPKGSSTT